MPEIFGPSGLLSDHEIAALFNVLALAHSGTDRVTVKLSFDRGATFDQTEEFAAGAEGYAPRLVQAEMAADYTLAVLFWVAGKEASLALVLVVDEQTVEGWSWLYDVPFRGEAGGMLDVDMIPYASFVPAEPPPLAPGMTEPVPPPDPADMHQLRLLLVD